jgi:hypothetical protein
MTVGICGNVICDGSLGSTPGPGELARVVVGLLVMVSLVGPVVLVVVGAVVVVVVADVAVVVVGVVVVVVMTEAGLGRPRESRMMP